MLDNAADGRRGKSGVRRYLPRSVMSIIVLAAALHPAEAAPRGTHAARSSKIVIGGGGGGNPPMSQAKAKQIYLSAKELDDRVYPGRDHPGNGWWGCTKAIVLLHVAVISAATGCAAAIAEGGANVPVDAGCAAAILGVIDAVQNTAKECGSNHSIGANTKRATRKTR